MVEDIGDDDGVDQALQLLDLEAAVEVGEVRS